MVVPLRLDGTPKKKFEVLMHTVNGGMQKDIFIDGELLDWSVDTESLRDAMRMGPKYARAVREDIQQHFVESVSDFIGRKVTAQEIQNAIKIGWI